jgi:hypothetical protein
MTLQDGERFVVVWAANDFARNAELGQWSFCHE